MLSHRNAITFVDWMGSEFQINGSDRVMSRAPLKFDLSVFDIFNTLSAGATLICYDWNNERKGDIKHTSYVQLLEREHATILYTTPSTLITLREKGGLFSSPNRLRTIMYAGEPFPVSKLSEIMFMAPNTRVANIYGPTETNIVTYHWVSHKDLENNVIPLGKVVDDTEIVVVSEDGRRECAPGEIGELWCRGGTVTLGYLNRSDLTSACQADSPFHSYPAKYWKTGDYGYRDEHGILYYKGRNDHMYKVNGYRIEIGEIEEALAKVPYFYESCITIEDREGQKQIVCHYSLKGNLFDIEATTNILLSQLQSFKIPSAFIEYDELPKTSSGKIDRARLRGRCH
jgi:acyl-coenzyme A synthetase/AMP-(fatty) acid ligase